MSDFDYVNWIFNPLFLGKNQEMMIEKRNAKGHKPHIVNIQNGIGVVDYRLYDFGSASNSSFLKFFNNTYDSPPLPDAPEGLLAFCDYIITAECGGRLFILLIELKRGKNVSHAKEQIDGAKVFIDYVLNTAERIKDNNNMGDFDKSQVDFRKIIIEKVKKETTGSHIPGNLDKHGYNTYRTIANFNIREVIGSIN